ncbi:MAG TPA: hypothetical protein VJ576_05505 [Rhodocyclaceae bacterium]|nr:hypothetical protein [Rhodocyclaceae bacterium]
MTSLPKLLMAAALAAGCALPAAPAFADPPPWAPAHGYRAKQHRYIYYPEYQVYYAPETQLWFWFGGGQWRTGVSLPAGMFIGGAPGVSLMLDTGYPYQRHGYVVERYGRGYGGGGGHGHHKHRHGDDDDD